MNSNLIVSALPVAPAPARDSARSTSAPQGRDNGSSFADSFGQAVDQLRRDAREARDERTDAGDRTERRTEDRTPRRGSAEGPVRSGSAGSERIARTTEHHGSRPTAKTTGKAGDKTSDAVAERAADDDVDRVGGDRVGGDRVGGDKVDDDKVGADKTGADEVGAEGSRTSATMPVDLSLLGLPAALRAVLATATPTAGLGGTGQRVSGTTVDAGITPVALQSGTAPQSGAGPQSGAAPQLGTAPQSGIAPQPGAAPGSGSAALPATTIPGQLISTRPGAAVDGSTPSGASVASRSPGSPVPAAGAGATPAETLASTVPASTVPASVVSASVLSTSGSSGNTVPGLRTAPAALITTAVTSLPANVRPAGAGEGSTSAPTAVTAVAGPAIAATVVATGNPASAVAGTQQASTSVAATDAAPATPTAAVAAPAMTAGDAGGGQDSGGQPGRPAQPVATAAATTRVVTEASSGAPVPVVPAAGPAVAQPGVTQTVAASRPVPVPDTDASTVPGTMPAPPASSVVTAPITSNVSTPPMPLPLTNPAAFAYGIAGRLGELAPETDALHRMTIEVNPQGLGPVRVTAEVSGGALHVSLVGASEAARHALSAAVGDLQRELVTSNFTSTSIDVRADSGATQQRFTGDSQFGGRPGQGQSQQSSGSEGGYPSTHAGSLFAADEARAGRRSSAAAAEGRLDLRV